MQTPDEAAATAELIRRLWGMQGYLQQNIFQNAETALDKELLIAQMEDVLRLLKEEPESVATLCLSIGVNCDGGLKSMNIITGNSPGIAASYLSIREDGIMCMEELAPALMEMSLMVDLQKGGDEPLH